MAVTVLAVSILLALSLTGIISQAEALTLFVVIELPLILAALGITVLRLRRIAQEAALQQRRFRDHLVAVEPLAGPAVYEFTAYASLVALLARRLYVPAGATPFGYTKGTLSIPIALVVASLIEAVAVHFLIPWVWLRIVLLIVTAWGIVFLAGVIAMKIVYPHYLSGDTLYLRYGAREVAQVPLASIAQLQQRPNYAHTQVAIDGEAVVLTQFHSTNVRVSLNRPCSAAPPLPKKKLPAGFQAREFLLYVEDPEEFVTAVAAER